MSAIYRDIGILGVGLWDGEVITNDFFGPDYLRRAQAREPFRGIRGDDGTVRIAGLVLDPRQHARTIAAIERSFADGYRGTVRRRRFPDHLKASEAEADAARKALADAGLQPSEVDLLLVQSYLPDVPQPKNAGLIAEQLGIRNAASWEVDSLCNSVISQANVAAALIHSGQVRHALCVQSVAYSRTSNPGTSAAVLDGDMASAFVMGRRPGAQMTFAWRTDGRLHDSFQLRWMTPAEAPPRRYWEPSQERLLVYHDEALQREVMSGIAEHARIVCTEVLRRLEIKLEEVELFLSHQPLAWFSAFMEDVLGLPDGIAFHTFEEYASINSCSIAASMCAARKQGRLRPGTKLLLFGPATGNVYGAAAMRF
ncbi:MAG: 3-oxoacyl-[acyl-carrier-protein] synthase III C-terminal domain-containing protein [Myxococcales bacterium]|nr:hypothetical protein [Myxococcota bacterium]MDW8280653.1 3-oxoacyl-[acyl-carrier-protein] synthase III C-terminal domain-containing protein [Myxococcales bacterium]